MRIQHNSHLKSNPE